MRPQKKTKKREPTTSPFDDIKLGRHILLICALTTTVMTPSLTIDAFNPAKFALMTFGILVITIKYWKFINSSLNEFRLNSVFFVILSVCTIVLIFHNYSISERIFGFEGRNFGFIVVVSLWVLGIYAFIAARRKTFSPINLFRALAFTNMFVTFVSFIQQKGWAFTQFNNQFGILPSTLGNPNFLSAFVALSIVGIIGCVLDDSTVKIIKIIGIIQVCFSIYVIRQSDSLQGIAALIVSLGVYLLLVLKNFLPRKALFFLFFSISALVLSFSIMGLPSGVTLMLKSQQTLLFRSVYWRIGLKMLQDSPFIGQGFDAYLDNFRRFLNSSFVDTIGAGVISDSPHNLMLDFLVSGGFLLGGLFLALILITSRNLVVSINKEQTRKLRPTEYEILAIFFVSFLAISFISPFNLALFVWLPVVIGMSNGLNSEKVISTSNISKIKIQGKGKSFSAPALMIFILVVCNPISGFLPMATEIRYRSAVESGNFYQLKAVALDWPFSAQRAVAIAHGMIDSSFANSSSPDQATQSQLQLFRETAMELAISATKANPKNYESWKFIYEFSQDASLKTKSLDVLKELDPYNVAWTSK